MLKCGVLDKNFNLVTTLINYTSFIWTDRFFGAGEFELVLPAGPETYHDIQLGYYISCDYFNNLVLNKAPNSEIIDDEAFGEYPLMIVETIEMNSKGENGPEFKITGRSLESIFDRRIIWGGSTIYAKDDMLYDNKISSAILKLIGENLGFIMFTKIGDGALDSSVNEHPTILRRGINSKVNSHGDPELDENSIYRISMGSDIGTEWGKTVTEDYDVTSIAYLDGDMEFSNDDTLYSAVYDNLCKLGIMSVRVFRRFKDYPIDYERTEYDELTRIYPKNSFSIRMMYPNRRTIKRQNALIFSEKMNNLQNVNYIESISDYKNVSYVTSSETDKETGYMAPYILDQELGFERREIHSDSDISREDDDCTVRDHDSIMNVMMAKGQSDLNDHTPSYVFEGDIANNQLLKYKYDYDLGDIVNFVNPFGDTKEVMITEVTLSSTSQGLDIVPSFEDVKEINVRDLDYAMQAGYYQNDGKYIPWETLKKDGYVMVDSDGRFWTEHNLDEPGILILDSEVKHLRSNCMVDDPNIKKLILPDTINEINSYTFADNRGLENVILSENIKYIGMDAFGLLTSGIRNVKLPKNIIEIGYSAFANIEQTVDNRLTPDVYIPDSCCYIGSWAFAGNRINNVYFSEAAKNKQWVQFNNRDPQSGYAYKEYDIDLTVLSSSDLASALTNSTGPDILNNRGRDWGIKLKNYNPIYVEQ